MIISVSRRCDIPRFRLDWFMERLDAGFVDVVNPFNAAQTRRVSLLPDDAEVFVFWTRDPRPVLVCAEKLEKAGRRFYVMVTVTGYPSILEPNVPPAETICAAMNKLAQIIGKQRVIWRYDPVFISSITNSNFHQNNFSALAQRLHGSVGRVIVSLYDGYKSARQRVNSLEQNDILKMTHNEDINALLGTISETARTAGMEIQSCAADDTVAASGIKAGACIDAELIRDVWGIEAGGRDKNQRPRCRCAKSVDIGRYNDCAAGCVYCYARSSPPGQR
ncbi:MAG: DUF1848 domain-containing protein [Treponema sp.]|jgi:hypothetical protein|nr:DUF1848 domain-containing protein [Treponema sp.]